MEGMFFPALHLGDFHDGLAALSSIGVYGLLADFCVSGLSDSPGSHVAYEADMIGTVRSDVKTVLIMAPIEGGQVRLCLGFPGALAATKEGALLMAVNAYGGPSTGKPEKAPSFYAFQWAAPRGGLQ